MTRHKLLWIADKSKASCAVGLRISKNVSYLKAGHVPVPGEIGLITL